MNTLGAYRGLKRLTTAAMLLLFGVSLIVVYLYLSKASDLWTIAVWLGVSAPLVATLLILGLLSVGWWRPGLSPAAESRRLRVPTALWILIGIEIPWILAWLGADATGNWWQHLHAGTQPAPYLWAVRLSCWLVAYALASGLGVLATILVDIRLTDRRGANLK